MAVSDDYQNAIERLAAQTAKQVQDETDPLLIVALINRARAVAVGLADVYAARQIEDLMGDVVTPTGVLPADESERLTKAVDTVMSAAPKSKLTRTEVQGLIESAGIDADVYDIPAITARINSWITDLLDPDEPDFHAHTLDMGSFMDIVAENPKKLSARGLFPPPPPNTPEYAQWEIDSQIPDIDSDAFDDWDPIWSAEPDNAGMRLERLARSEVFNAAQNGTNEALSSHKVKGRYLGWVRQLEAGHCQLCEWWAKDGRVWPKSHRMVTHPNCNCVQRVVVTDTRPKPVKRKKRNG